MNEFKEWVKALISLILDYIGTFTLLFLIAGYIDEEIPAFLKKVLVDPKEIHYVPTKGKKNSYTIFEVVPEED